jgi:predicted signal transduction protein with EAL and GGDEF domain
MERSVGLLAIVLAILTLICGLRAVQLWQRSSGLDFETEGPEPADKTLRRVWRESAITKASERSATLDKQARRWIAAAVVLCCLAMLAGY